MKTMLKTGLVAACALAFAVPAAAQVPGLGIKVNPRVGLYVPLSDLANAQNTATNIIEDRSGNLAFGLGVELDVAMLPVNIRANVDYATGAEVSEQGVTDPTKTTLLVISGDVILRPLPKIILVQPYVFAGGGLRQYNFDVQDPSATDFQDASDPTVHVGGGLDLTLGPLALNAEVGDYVSWYAVQDGVDAEMQHDLFVSVGLVFGFL